jgi:uncharacterized BrkB/YihY/UPF0761 family membrane protein
MRRAMILACVVASALTLVMHATTLLGAVYDGKVLVYGALGSVVAICVPAALMSGERGPKDESASGRKRSRLISLVLSLLTLYVFALGMSAMTADQRAELFTGGRISLWRGERNITVGQARMFTAFPLPFFVACGLILWDRRERERASLEE